MGQANANLCTELYKTLSNLNPQCKKELFEENSSSYSTRRPNDEASDLKGAMLWNHLAEHIKFFENLYIFKHFQTGCYFGFIEEGRAKMSSIKALIFINILLLITSHTCRNRLCKIKAERLASNCLENSEDARDINGLYFTSERNSSLGGDIGNLLPTRNRLKRIFFNSRIC